jgi:hypothetical protein
MARLQTAPDGTFVIRNVAAGSYALHGFGRQVGNQATLSAAAFGALQITVEGDMPNLALKIAPGVTMRGRIVLEGSATPPVPARVRVAPRPINFATGPMGGGPAESVTSEDWTFETKNLVGTRVIAANVGAPGWMLKRVTRDGKDITDQPIDFGQGDVNGIEITLTSNVASVSGTVTEANRPVSECVVLLFAEDATKWTFPSRHMTAARPDAKGAFTASGLPAGNYLAVAIPLVQGEEWQNPLTLEQYRGLATSVTLFEGGKASVALRLIRR